MSELAKRLIYENLKTKNPYLDLGNCGLDGTEDEIYRPLENAHHLKTLIFSNEWVEYNERFKSNIRRISRNEGKSNSLIYLPLLPSKLERLVVTGDFEKPWKISNYSMLSKLFNLKNLDISHNVLLDNSFIETLKKLIILYLVSSNISFVSSLLKLKILEISTNNISDLSPLVKLRELNVLHIGGNQISDINPLSKLVNLNVLDISLNKITNYSPLSNLKELRVIQLIGNNVSDISFLANLSKIESVLFMDNDISDIFCISNLKNITKAYFISNKISDVSALTDLKNITDINLLDNQISDINQIKKIILNKNIKYLNLNRNPIPYLPKELLGDYDFDNCLEELRNYYQNQEFVPNKEIKVVLLGNGMVGKSTLLNRFLSPNGKWEDIKIAESDRTEGIVIKENIDFELEEGKTIKLNIWDFGGQEVYHGTHRLFLNKDAVYIVLWALETKEKPEEIRQDLSYWLDYVQDLAEDSPVVVVHSQYDKQSEQDEDKIYEQTDTFLREEKYKKSITTRNVSFSAKTGQGLKELNEAIRKAIKTRLSARVETEIPKKWKELRDELRALRENEENKQNEISYQDYLLRCEKREISTSEAETVLLFLHRTGFLYYDTQLSENIILNQTWAIEAIYEALKPKGFAKRAKGSLEYEDLESFWIQKGYSKNEVQTFIDFMVSSEICFCEEQQDYKELENPTFVVPQYLPQPSRSNIFWETKPEESFYLRYTPQFFHKGIAERFLSRLGRLSNSKDVWKDGIRIFSEDFSGNALIEFDRKDKEVNITTNSFELLKAVIKELDRILDEGSQTKPSEKVAYFYSLDGNDFVDNEELQKQIRDNNYNSNIRTLNDNLLVVNDFVVKYRLAEPQKVASKQHQREDLENQPKEKSLLEEAKRKQNNINPNIEAAINALENAKYDVFFEEMDKVEIPSEYKTMYEEMRIKVITMNYPANFYQSLKVIAKEINKKI